MMSWYGRICILPPSLTVKPHSGASRADSVPGGQKLFDRAVEPVNPERLEKIINRAEIERPERITLVRGRKDDGGRLFQAPKHFQTRQLREPDIEKDQVELPLGHLPERLLAGPCHARKA